MLFLKYVLLWGGFAMIAIAAGILICDLRCGWQRTGEVAEDQPETVPPAPPVRWQASLALALLAWGPILLALSILVVPSAMAGVLLSQARGTLPGTLDSGVPFIIPFAESVALFDTRDQSFTTGSREAGRTGQAKRFNPLNVQAKGGLTLGLSITVRYRLDPKRPDHIQSSLPLPVERELVPAVVASAWRELVPNFTVREVFAAKREEVRKRRHYPETCC
jgi:regulator of protease activity HflC (stomatin/prohibitin superfamily)